MRRARMTRSLHTLRQRMWLHIIGMLGYKHMIEPWNQHDIRPLYYDNVSNTKICANLQQLSLLLFSQTDIDLVQGPQNRWKRKVSYTAALTMKAS